MLIQKHCSFFRLKTLFVFIVCFSFYLPSFCQSDSLFAKNSEGKFIYYEVVPNSDSLSYDLLFNNAKQFIKRFGTNYGEQEANDDIFSGKVITNADFWVYKKNSGINKKRHGVISFKLAIEVKVDRYRYYFSDFEFREYRYDSRTARHKFSKSTTPLEAEKNGSKKLWTQHRFYTFNKMQEYSNLLKEDMARKPNTLSEPKPIKLEDKW